MRDMKYEYANVGYDDQYPKKDGGGIKCKNYEVCSNVLPKWWYDCKGQYLCTNRDMMFGTWGEHKGKGVLEVKLDIECPICLETKKTISQPNSGGELCIEGKEYNIKNKIKKFDGRRAHWTNPFEGTRYAMVFFTHTFKPPNAVLRNIVVTKDGIFHK